MAEAMKVLTGAPSFKYTNSDLTDANLWTIASSADTQGYMLTAATDHASYGLAAGHAYTVLGCYEIKDANGKSVAKLMHMRNPWSTD